MLPWALPDTEWSTVYKPTSREYIEANIIKALKRKQTMKLTYIEAVVKLSGVLIKP